MHIPENDAQTRTANLLGALALEAAHAQQEAASKVVGQAGAAAAALALVGAAPGRTIEQLRGPLGLSQPGATRLFDRLAREGWIDRGATPGHRGLHLVLTEAGEETLRRVLAARREVLTDLLQPLDGPELSRLAALLERMLAARTTGRAALERLCRLCERGACRRCPVGQAMDDILAAQGEPAEGESATYRR
jgi:DNA-binding MarR family transcriptional regulator